MEKKSPMDSKTLIAIAIAMAFWFGWQKYLEKKYPAMNLQTEQPMQAEESKKTEKSEIKEEARKEIKKVTEEANLKPEKFWTFEGNTWKVVVSSRGGRISQAHLKKFTSQKDTKEIPLIEATDLGLLRNAVLKNGEKEDLSKINFSISEKSLREVVLEGETRNIKITKVLTFDPEKYLISTKMRLQGELKDLKNIAVMSSVSSPKEKSQGFSFFGFAPPANHQEFFIIEKNKSHREAVVPGDDLNKNYEQTSLASLGTRYFTTLFINKSGILPNTVVEKNAENSTFEVVYPILDTTQKEMVFDFDLFLGPKSIPLLKSISPQAEEVVDYGMFYFIARPLLAIMKWFFSIFGNYGVAIILLTILVRTLTFPFTYMAYKSTSALQGLQPEMAKLREKYKGDTQRLNTEMMRLYKENKVNPVGGCLPTLLQLPIFWALFQVLQNSIELYKAPFIWWIQDLSQKDPYYVLPILMGISMYFQTKLTPTTMDPAQQKVMTFMPIFFSLLMFSLPSGLTLYIFVSTVFGISQQLVLMKDKSKTAPIVLAAK